MTVEWVAPIGPFDGKEYVYFEGKMTGTIDRGKDGEGEYVAPIMMIYPRNDADRNGVGVVDWVNTALYHVLVDSDGLGVVCQRGTDYCDDGENGGHRNIHTIVQWSRGVTEDYLFEQGYTYMSVEWDKSVTEQMGPEPTDGTTRRRLAYGTIEEATDGLEILRDAARFLRDPEVEGDPPATVRASDYVQHYGLSQGGFLARHFLLLGLNTEEDDSLIYDGFMISQAGGLCWVVSDTAPGYLEGAGPTPCFAELPVGEAKVLAIDTESDLEILAGFFSRDLDDSEPNFRKWEMAGVSHIPAGMGLDLGWMGEYNVQNPASSRPVYRAGFHHMKAWMEDDTEPPDSIYLDGAPDKMGNWIEEADEDGNALGGIRLPHMPREIDGDPAGAPTGLFAGSYFEALAWEPPNIFVALGGSYTRFDEDDLEDRYPSVDAYQDLVNAAADELVSEGYILDEDRDRYAELPADLAPVPDPPDPEPDGDDDGSCSAAGGSSSSGVALLLFLSIVVAARRARSRSRIRS